MAQKFNIFDLGKPNIRILHYSWFAFFMTFVVWLGLGPIMPFIKEALSLTDQQAKVLLILNVAMTIPARIVVSPLPGPAVTSNWRCCVFCPVSSVPVSWWGFV